MLFAARGLKGVDSPVPLPTARALATHAPVPVDATGKLVAEHNSHDVGAVPISGGPVLARFPLAVHGKTFVTDITTT